MKRLVYIAIAGALAVIVAAAQDPDAASKEALAKAKAEAGAQAGTVQMKMVGAVRGKAVAGAPYSGEEVNETNQTLADGTRIHRETRTTVYRDSQGRTRRETPDGITIADPVANATYLLDPKTMTGQKLTMTGVGIAYARSGSFSSTISAPGPATLTVTSNSDGPGTITLNVNGVPLDEKIVAEAMAKAKASGSTQTITYERREVTTTVGGGSGPGTGAGMEQFVKLMKAPKPAGESLGKQMMEGVNAEGTRNVTTIEAGAIGNDRPIQISSESWYSPDLQTVIMSKHSDPRTGDESFRLTNINRGEPAAYLFQLPAGYQISERK